MEIFVVIVSWLLFGGATSYFATQRGRDPFAWFLIGMLLGILGLLLLFLLPPLEIVSKESESKGTLSLPETEDPGYRMKAWYYIDQENQQVGPKSFNQLKKAGEAGKIQPDTLLWCEGMSGWKSIKELPEINEALQ